MSHRDTCPEIRKRFLSLDAANVADVLDELGLYHQGLAADVSGFSVGRLAGWAYTIAGHMVPYDDNGDPAKMEACGGVSAGEVTVWSGGGSGVCYFGELIALGMMEAGSVGAVVDGGVRDTRWLAEHGFPVFGRFRTAIQSIGRWRVTDWQVPVYLPGATSEHVIVHPGDFILGDEDGVVVVPAGDIDQVLTRAERMTETEQHIRQAISDGMSLNAALATYGHV